MNTEIDHRYQIDIEKSLKKLKQFTRPRALEAIREIIPTREAEPLFEQWLRDGFIQLKEIAAPPDQLSFFDETRATLAENEHWQSPEAQIYTASFHRVRKRKEDDVEHKPPVEAILIRAQNAWNEESQSAKRNGQGLFRKQLVLLHKQCQICGSEVEAVLQAAHIEPYANGGSFVVTNGLVLRSDYHVLFDRLLLGIAPDFSIHVAPRLRETEYSKHRELRLPRGADSRYIARMQE